MPTLTCDNPPCVRPLHLSEGTDFDNMKDRDLHGRNGRATLTWELAQQIRAGKGTPQAPRAARYGVSVALVSMIDNNLVWQEERYGHSSTETPPP